MFNLTDIYKSMRRIIVSNDGLVDRMSSIFFSSHFISDLDFPGFAPIIESLIALKLIALGF